MVDYIDQHREVFGVESICNELPIASSTDYAAKVAEPCERARRDAQMMPVLLALFVANYRVYGARKLWIAARRVGHDIGRGQVARLMGLLDIEGVTRHRKRVWTTRSDGGPRSPDLVERNFTAAALNQLWVTDLTYVPTWSGVAYVAFIVDVYSSHGEIDRIIGAHNRSSMIWLTERVTRYSIPVTMPLGEAAVDVLAGLAEACEQVPPHLRKSFSLDQGSEWAEWETLAVAYRLEVPCSSWSR